MLQATQWETMLHCKHARQWPQRVRTAAGLRCLQKKRFIYAAPRDSGLPTHFQCAAPLACAGRSLHTYSWRACRRGQCRLLRGVE